MTESSPSVTGEEQAAEKTAGIADRIEVLPDRVLLYADDGEHALEGVHSREIPIESALVRRATLEDVFLRLTGRSLVE